MRSGWDAARLLVMVGAVTAAMASSSAPTYVPTTPRRPPEPDWEPSLEEADFGPRPTEYEQIAKEGVVELLKDPESARFKRVSLPRKEYLVSKRGSHEAIFGWSVCLEVNARNSYGGYVGFKPYWVLIRDGKAMITLDATRPIRLNGDMANCEDGPDPSAPGAE